MRRCNGRVYGNTQKRLLAFIALLGIFTVGILHAQPCKDYHTIFCTTYADQGFIPLKISRDFYLPKDTTVAVQVPLYSGTDYHIGIAADDVFGGKARFIIVEGTNTIYSNSDDNLTQNFEFTAIQRSLITIFIYTPQSNHKITGSRRVMGCIGVLIESKPSEKTGF